MDINSHGHFGQNNSNTRYVFRSRIVWGAFLIDNCLANILAEPSPLDPFIVRPMEVCGEMNLHLVDQSLNCIRLHVLRSDSLPTTLRGLRSPGSSNFVLIDGEFSAIDGH